MRKYAKEVELVWTESQTGYGHALLALFRRIDACLFFIPLATGRREHTQVKCTPCGTTSMMNTRHGTSSLAWLRVNKRGSHDDNKVVGNMTMIHFLLRIALRLHSHRCTRGPT